MKFHTSTLPYTTKTSSRSSRVRNRKHYVSLSSLLSALVVSIVDVEIAIGVVAFRSLNNGFCEDV